jgi:hypothetical protein
VKKLHPLADTVATTENVKPSDTDVWQEMLKELREIRENTRKP